ncbi:PHP domain-containing protein [Guggenheimella bovis]
MKCDLHLHSYYSDGSDSIDEICDMAMDAGLDAISITDHDTLFHLRDVLEARKKFPLKILLGTEMSCSYKGKKVHILAYDFRENAPNIERIARNTREKRHRRSLEQLEQILQDGYDIDMMTLLKRFEKSQVLYKQHVMKELMRLGAETKIYGDLYRKYFKGKDIEYPDVKDVIEAIHKDGGVAYLAHPNETSSFEFIDEFISMGLDGIEAIHPSHDEEAEKRSRSYGLPCSGGSDYHGLYEDALKPPGTHPIDLEILTEA